jgi:hypothetical protein
MKIRLISDAMRKIALRRWVKVGKRQRHEIAMKMVAAKRKKREAAEMGYSEDSVESGR